MKKIISLVLCLVMVCSMSLPVFGLKVTELNPKDIFNPELIEQEKKELEELKEKSENYSLSFKDVVYLHWAYEAIMEMTKMGLFTGTTAPDANGVGVFSPDTIMTRAQFIVVVTRALFAAELASAEMGDVWYETNYKIAIKNGLINDNDLGGFYELNQPISREEMAYIMSNAMHYNGEFADKLVDKSVIADFETVNSNYADDVLACYSLGIIAGVDSKGTFAPKMTVTRAQGATILYRLINPEVRQVIE